MEFPHSFYEDEIRSDFLIPSMVKRTWAAQIEILADLDRACQKNGLEYYAEWGTLLGTIRHGGFIPWDDDMDICMKRKDYMYLIENVSTLLSEDHSIVSYRSSREFNQMLCRLVSSDHYRFDPDYMHKYSGLPIALGIDIFPMDYLSGDEQFEKEREERARLVYAVVNELAIYNTPPAKLEKNISRIESECRVRIDRHGDILTQLRILLEKIFAEVDEKDAKYITLYPIWLDDHGYRFPVEYYDKSVRLPFENVTIPVPVCYDQVLRRKYGDLYMKQIRSGGAHEYPYFEEHVNILREHFGYEWPSYRFDPSDIRERSVSEQADRTCLFVTYGVRQFDNMRSLAKRILEEGYKVTILPAARYDIAADMTGITVNTDDVPDEYYTEGLCGATVTHDPAVADDHFGIIVSNFQYDEYNLITTVDRKFYSRTLRDHCERLIYVPAFETEYIGSDDERAKKLMPLYVNTPLAVVCDEIVLHSDEMKKRYVECLTAFAGKRYEEIFEDRIKVITDETGSSADKPQKKKKIMFYLGIAFLAQNGDRAIDNIQRVFDIFEENKDRAEAVFVTQTGLKENLSRLYPDLYDKYMMHSWHETGENVYPEDIDAYYGEASEYATGFLNAKKPVMIMSCL